MHRKWTKGQKTNYPHEGNCEGCRASHLCNSCGAGLETYESCTNGRCRRCHHGVCTSGEGHGYGYPSGATGQPMPRS